MALLAPTRVLARQHERTLKARMPDIKFVKPSFNCIILCMYVCMNACVLYVNLLCHCVYVVYRYCVVVEKETPRAWRKSCSREIVRSGSAPHNIIPFTFRYGILWSLLEHFNKIQSMYVHTYVFTCVFYICKDVYVCMNDEWWLQVVVGTHALLQPSVSFSQLGIDFLIHTCIQAHKHEYPLSTQGCS